MPAERHSRPGRRPGRRPRAGAGSPTCRVGGAPPAKPRRPRRLIDYPRVRAGDGWRRWVPSWKLVAGDRRPRLVRDGRRVLHGVRRDHRPGPGRRREAQTTVVYYADGKTEIGPVASQNRRERARWAGAAARRRTPCSPPRTARFYQNRGVDPTSIVRAAWSNVRGEPLQGGSTITQQYVKNYFDLRDRTLHAQGQGVLHRAEGQPGQGQGRDPRGLPEHDLLRSQAPTASRRPRRPTSGSRCTKLTVSEGAFLAGIINAPGAVDPATAGRRRAGQAALELRARRDGRRRAGSARGPGEAASSRSTSKVEVQDTLAGQNGYLLGWCARRPANKAGITERDSWRPRAARSSPRSTRSWSTRPWHGDQGASCRRRPAEGPAGRDGLDRPEDGRGALRSTAARTT